VAEIIEHPAARGGITSPTHLTAAHDLSRFDCGNDALNDWLKGHALNSEGQSARTYVVCENNVVIGYYCISTGSIERRALPSKMKRQRGLPNQMPVANNRPDLLGTSPTALRALGSTFYKTLSPGLYQPPKLSGLGASWSMRSTNEAVKILEGKRVYRIPRKLSNILYACGYDY